MDKETVTLVIGISGIAATLISSMAGLYFVSKERSSSLRASLFSKQIDLISDINFKMCRFRVFASVLSEPNSPFMEQAKQDLRTCFKEFCELEEKGAVLLPVELWINLKSTHDSMSEIVSESESNSCIKNDSLKKLIAVLTKTALISRSVTGADELTEQAIGIFSNNKSFKRVAELDLKVLEDIVEKSNA